MLEDGHVTLATGEGLDLTGFYVWSKSIMDNLGYYGCASVSSDGAYWQDAYNRKANKGPVSVVTTTADTPGSVFSSLSSNSSERTGRSRSTARTTSLLFAENIFVSPSKLCSHFGDKLPVYDRVDP